MRRIDEWRVRLRSLLRRDAVERELDAELRFHLDQQIEENLAAGMDREEARYRALRAIGGVAQIQEQCRDTRRLNLMEGFVKDVIYAARMLRKSPAFTLTAVLSLGLAIGANAGVFSMINRLLLTRLSVTDPDSLVAVERVLPGGGTDSEFSQPVFQQFRDNLHVFSGMIGWASSRMSVNLGGEPEMIDAAFYSGDAFAVLGVEPILGRTFTVDDDRPGQPAVAVISDRYWRSRFGASPGVLNRTIQAKGVPVTILGVLPPGFTGLAVANDYPDVTMPFVWQARFNLNDNAVRANIMARLARGVTNQRARVEMNVMFARLLPDLIDPATPEQRKRDLLAQSIQLRPAGRGDHNRWEEYRLQLALLMAAVAIVLLIACANVASLMLARGSARQREMAVRSALGAGRFRLIRQLLTESLLVGALSGVAGFWMAAWIRTGLARLLGLGGNVSLDSRVFAFTAAVSLAAAMLFGLIPALRSSHTGLQTRSTAGKLTAARGLVIAQVALSLVLVIGAGLMVRSVRNLQHVDPGFDPENVLLFWMYPTTLGYEGPAEIRLYERLLERFNATHGVVQASMARHYMLQGARNFRRVSGIPAAVNVIAPGFFSTMRIALLSGRDFSPDDRADGAHVAIVDQHYADNKFPGENPLGKTVDFGGQTYRVVGVAANVRYFSLRQESSIPASQVFFPFTQVPRDQLGQMCFALRTSLDPALVLADARREAFAVEKNLPVVMATTQARQAEGSMREEWSLGILTAMFAVMAVLLACLGLYGTIAYTTARRTNEIGVRMALGASRAGVMRMVWNESALLVAAGVAIGTPGTIAAARSIRTWLFGVSPNDPLTIAAAAAVMIAVAAIAGFIPARRASRVDPVVALRHE